MTAILERPPLVDITKFPDIRTPRQQPGGNRNEPPKTPPVAQGGYNENDPRCTCVRWPFDKFTCVVHGPRWN